MLESVKKEGAEGGGGGRGRGELLWVGTEQEENH